MVLKHTSVNFLILLALLYIITVWDEISGFNLAIMCFLFYGT